MENDPPRLPVMVLPPGSTSVNCPCIEPPGPRDSSTWIEPLSGEPETEPSHDAESAAGANDVAAALSLNAPTWAAAGVVANSGATRSAATTMKYFMLLPLSELFLSSI